jgi:hypothetical protein
MMYLQQTRSKSLRCLLEMSTMRVIEIALTRCATWQFVTDVYERRSILNWSMLLLLLCLGLLLLFLSHPSDLRMRCHGASVPAALRKRGPGYKNELTFHDVHKPCEERRMWRPMPFIQIAKV